DLLRPVKQWQANQKIKRTSIDTIRGQVPLAETGWWVGGTPPFGFDLEYVDAGGQWLMTVRYLESGEKLLFEPHRNEPRRIPQGQPITKTKSDRARLVLGPPERARLIKRIFDMYLTEGLGFKSIAATLNEEGIPSPRDGSWSKNTNACWSSGTIRSILRNRLYTGDYVWNRGTQGKFNKIKGGRAVRVDRPRPSGKKRPRQMNPKQDWMVFPDTHPAIVSKEVFERVQVEMAKRGRSRLGAPHRSGRSKTAPYLLSGLVRCELCRHSFSGQRRKKGKPRRDGTYTMNYYYECSGFLQKGHSVCRGDLIRKEEIEAGVLDLIGHRVGSFLSKGGTRILEKMIARGLRASSDDPKQEMRKLEGEIGKVDHKIDKLIEHVLDRVSAANRVFLDRKLDGLRQERDGLIARLEELKALPATQVDARRTAKELVANMGGFEQIFEEGTLQEKKEFIRLFVEKIDLNTEERKARVHIRRFPAPVTMPGNPLLRMVAGAGFEPATFGLCLPLQLSLPCVGLWSGLSLHPQPLDTEGC
ncbi:MAG: recombinase family protein, partial [Candidatus Krumholzibacteriia bacterium]